MVGVFLFIFLALFHVLIDNGNLLVSWRDGLLLVAVASLLLGL